MTEAKIQPFCRAYKINLGFFEGTKVFPRSATDRIDALFFYNNHLCLKWKSENVSFIQAIEELKDNFRIVDNFITDGKVKSRFQYIYTPKEIESYLTKIITYNLETHNTDRAKTYVFFLSVK